MSPMLGLVFFSILVALALLSPLVVLLQQSWVRAGGSVSVLCFGGFAFSVFFWWLACTAAPYTAFASL